jgi:hypothetical protein
MQVQTWVLQYWEDAGGVEIQASKLELSESARLLPLREEDVHAAAPRSVLLATVSMAHRTRWEAEIEPGGVRFAEEAHLSGMMPALFDIFFDVLASAEPTRELRFVAESVLGRPPDERGFVRTRDGRWYLPELERLACLMRIRQHLDCGWLLRGGSRKRVLLAFDPASQQILDTKLRWTPLGVA